MDISAARPSRSGDEPQLKEIWKHAFGDDDSFIDLFMDELYKPGMASVAEMDGKVVSAIYLFRGTALVMPDGKAVPCPYCYTLGTLSDYRGHGLGAAVSEHIMRSAMDEAPMVALVPAQQSLYKWYADTFRLYPISACRENEIPAPDGSCVPPESRVHRVDSASYGKLHELMLTGQCHIRFSPELLEWYGKYIRRDGGGLYLVDIGGDVGCAAVEKDGDGLFVKELLLPHGNENAALSLLCTKLKADKVKYRTPIFFPGEGAERNFAVARTDGKIALPEKETIWWGLAFD
jgi:hypothetical protein